VEYPHYDPAAGQIKQIFRTGAVFQEKQKFFQDIFPFYGRPSFIMQGA
jgi:hypothetical protein